MEHLICLDSVWEHDPDGRRIRRVAGVPTDASPVGEWTPYVELAAGTIATNPTSPTGEHARPGQRLLIRRRADWKRTTDITAMVMVTDAALTGRWTPHSEPGTIVGAAGQVLMLLHGDPSPVIGIAGILDTAEQRPTGPDDEVSADYYWPVAQTEGLWAVFDRHGGTPLIVTDGPDVAREVSILLARHPIQTFMHITAALLGTGEWDVGPAAVHHGDDDVIAVQLEQAGWAVEELAAIGPRARRELLLEAYVIEQRGVPWPHVRRHQKTSR